MAYETVFSALSDPTRRRVFEMVAARPTTVQALADRLPVSRPAVSQHLRVLSDAGLVAAKAEGTRRIYAARPEQLSELRTWLDRMWSDALQAFAAEAERENAK